ncbi:hypothetical protein GUJ93_ZPchr0011g28922 [Zizania palustris]|uniref:Uncharacterized protein n=1 Tax=Zizania palustris TaxID=103762 RepID=A0A8J5WFI9_ZIZPA|nr:hypothetical protein GUJ93_ZPchr0011g28922 [Zizania palustris]
MAFLSSSLPPSPTLVYLSSPLPSSPAPAFLSLPNVGSIKVRLTKEALRTRRVGWGHHPRGAWALGPVDAGSDCSEKAGTRLGRRNTMCRVGVPP